MKDIKGLVLIICFIGELAFGIVAVTGFSLIEERFFLYLFLALVFVLVFISVSVYEVVVSDRIGDVERVLWIVGLVLLVNFSGIIYLILRRRRVLSASSSPQTP